MQTCISPVQYETEVFCILSSLVMKNGIHIDGEAMYNG